MRGITKAQRKRDGWKTSHIDGATAFVICSKRWGRSRFWPLGGTTMTRISIKTFLIAAAFGALPSSAFAQAAAPTPWELKSDMGYAYGKDGKTLAYKLGTSNAGTLLKGAKK